MKLGGILPAMLLVLPAAASAANKLIVPGPRVSVAQSAMTVAPDREWNKLEDRPGPSMEWWTLDGHKLNELAFYGDITPGTSLLGKRVGKEYRPLPLPLFNTTMLISDIPAMFESFYRVGANIDVISIGVVEPTTFLGRPGVRFTYDYTPRSDEVRRKGEGYGAIVDGRLYLITFEAPALHFFDAGIASARAVVASATVAAQKN